MGNRVEFRSVIVASIFIMVSVSAGPRMRPVCDFLSSSDRTSFRIALRNQRIKSACEAYPRLIPRLVRDVIVFIDLTILPRIVRTSSG